MKQINLASATPNTFSSPSREREGVDIRFTDGELGISEQWHMSGWTLQFLQLPGKSRLAIDGSAGRTFIKVVTGQLTEPNRTPFAGSREIRNTLVTSDAVRVGDVDTLVAVFVETSATPAKVDDMAKLRIEGPNAEAFRWQTFEAKFGSFTDVFDGDDAYMSGGFHLLNGAGTEVSYVNLWTAGKGVNLTTHNHSNDPSPLAPAFAEVHWVFSNGTGRGGMYGADAPDGPKVAQYPMQRGDEHGAFFATDAAGNPRLLANGAVDYPWHGWEAGTDDEPGQAYDVVAAFETNPEFVRV